MTQLKLILRATLITACLAASGFASAQSVTASKGISITATLTSKCQVATASAGTITLPFGTYVAFGGAVAATQASVSFECTRGMGATPTFAWDGATSSGVVAGLRYELTVTNGTRVDGTAPVVATANSIGTPDTYPVLIDGSLLAGQAGTQASGTQTVARTLTVTF